MVVPTSWEQEKRWLTYVLKTVAHCLNEAENALDLSSNRSREERRTLWEEGARSIVSSEDWIELAQASEQMGHGERTMALYKAQSRRLEKMLHSPYFGRIDFKEQGLADADSIYIGIGGLHNPANGNLIVYDWRAPICSLFYDAELGPAAYECQAGTVLGEVLLKRQYRIVNGNLEFMFDTDIKIDDDMLQELLGRNIDEKMRTIVTSIQREQNRVIRDTTHDLLLVQGPAGSGKTAIALHRAAYLLYRFREQITARNIVIFSPNEVFSDYISAVLPELGEENVIQTTFHEYLSQYLQGPDAIESIYDQLEMIFSRDTGSDVARIKTIQYKASPHFARLLKRYVTYLEDGQLCRFFDVTFRGRLVLSAGEMAGLFRQYADMPYAKRLEKIRQRVLFLLAPFEEERRSEIKAELAASDANLMDWEIRQETKRRISEEFSPIRNQLATWAAVNMMTLYRQLFERRSIFKKLAGEADMPADWDEIRSLTLTALSGETLLYEDAVALFYLQCALTQEPVQPGVRHVIVDEAQDYSPLQYELFRLIFPRASYTIVGDLYQTIHPYMHVHDYQHVREALHKERAVLIELSKSYRSTEQVMRLAQAVQPPKGEVTIVRKDGPKPAVIRVNGEKRLIAAIELDIERLQAKGLGSVAVLCKTAAQAAALYSRLRRELEVRLITAADVAFRTGALILPAYLAKGLEFDAVIIADASADVYGAETERGLFYTACTRALHELRLYYQGEVTPFVAQIDPDMYAAQDVSDGINARLFE
jgi:DNA helicase-2/ATP-dependent DNA helicase PcrA